MQESLNEMDCPKYSLSIGNEPKLDSSSYISMLTVDRFATNHRETLLKCPCIFTAALRPALYNTKSPEKL